jgi:GR25 family glycosyltransferase involved in LPS biosynthesis
MNSVFYILIIFLVFYILNQFVFQENFENNTNYQTYVINLDRSKDRLKNITKEMNNAHLSFIRWNAFDGSKLNFNKLIQKNVLNEKNKMMVGAIGCSMSHISLWKEAIKHKKNILVFEDDVNIPKDFSKELQIYLNQLPKKWDILYLGASNINGKKYSNNLLVPNIMPYSNSTHNTGMYAMLINYNFLQKLIENNLPISDAIDISIRNKLFNKSNIYICNPSLIKHDNTQPSMRRLVSNKPSTPKWFLHIQNKIVVTN